MTGGGGEGMEEGEEEDEKVDPDAEGVAKMRASEIKAELDVRGVSYAGIFEKVRALAVKSTTSLVHGSACSRAAGTAVGSPRTN